MQHSLLCMLFFFSTVFAYSQTTSYFYDASGNRSSRVISLSYSPPSNTGNSPSKAPNSEGDMFASKGDESTIVDNLLDAENSDTDSETETSYSDYVGDISYRIYPNPVRSTLSIKVSDSKTSIDKVSVYDVSGKMHQQLSACSSCATIDFSTYPKGIYILRLHSGEEEVSWKIIKE